MAKKLSRVQGAKRGASSGAIYGTAANVGRTLGGGRSGGVRGFGIAAGAGAVTGAAIGAARPKTFAHPNTRNAKTAVRTTRPQPVRPGSRVPKKRM